MVIGRKHMLRHSWAENKVFKRYERAAHHDVVIPGREGPPIPGTIYCCAQSSVTIRK